MANLLAIARHDLASADREHGLIEGYLERVARDLAVIVDVSSDTASELDHASYMLREAAKLIASMRPVVEKPS